MMRPGSVMYSRAAEGIVRRNCPFCGRQLTAHQGVNGGLCGAAECHDRMIEQVGAERLARKRRENEAHRDAMFAAAADAVARAEAALPAGDGGIVRGAVPHQDQPLAPLPPARRAAFEAHLDTVIAEAWAEGPPALDLARRAALEAPEPPLLDAACAACQGACCKLGGDTGFLVWTDVQRHRQRHPEATAAQVRALYLGLLPEQSVRGACVYQSATGCTVPRHLRNDQCNAFHCKSLKLLAAAWAAEPGARGAVLVAALERKPRGVAAYDAARGRVEIARLPGAAEPG